MPKDLDQNSTLNMEAAQKAGFTSGERFFIDNFTYINSVVVARMFQNVENTDFLGITVCTYQSRVHCIIKCNYSVL